ncbi:transcriptional regulator [Desulfomonile tiedjei DSM 6799]|uniref:Transcriptional regulator n=1 Tax=Desulfomonile tiedjei (strain ATCC 49306 / DSM 6799 / DCB-1) TaxID=706587 RepID=I4C2T4_DESTA|nr:transcriptional regulator [Desulfomonile tiedjei DSM 6799]
MEMRQLKYFVAVAEELHFGRAAERLNICQPPLSQQIKNLEEELGAQLFHRKNKKVSLTDAGAAFLEDARAILDRARCAAERAHGIASGVLGRISLGLVLPAMDTFVPDAIREFRLQNPLIEIQLLEMGSNAQLTALKAGDIHMGVMRLFQHDLKGLLTEKIVEEPYILAIPSGHRFESLHVVPLALLDGEPLIFFPRRLHAKLHDRMIECLEAVGCNPVISQETTTKFASVALVAAGFGVALVPQSTRKHMRSGVVYRNVAGDLPVVELSLVWQEQAALPGLDNLIATIRDMSPSKKEGQEIPS